MVFWFVLSGCGSKEATICSVTWEQPLPMTAVVTWTGEGEPPNEINWTDDDSTVATVPFNSEGVAEIYGLLPGYTHPYELTGSGACQSEFQAEPLPFYFPNFSVETYHSELMSEEDYVLGVFVTFGFGYTAYVINREGRPFWMYHEEGRMSAMTELDEHSDGVMLNSYPNNLAVDDGNILRINPMGERLETIATPLGHHAFEQLPDGTIAWPAFDIREWTDPDTGETVLVSGDTIVERGLDGSLKEVFNSWDWLEVTKHDRWDDAFLFQGAHDWTHANTLGYYPDSDSYLVSLPYIQSIIEVDRTLGSLMDEINPSSNGFPDEPYVFQHFPTRLENGNLLLMSHAEAGTAAIEYQFSESGQMVPIWSHGEGEGITGNVLGQATRLSNGNTLVNYGGAGLMQEVTPDNVVVWELYTGMGIWMGSGQLLEQWP
ncbi:MAG: aryl-sulfate sulfotransferase [Myxococcota bacterium]|nr:aryl-sulfate sulfotransferase [Myxococcota bacterium]